MWAYKKKKKPHKTRLTDVGPDWQLDRSSAIRVRENKYILSISNGLKSDCTFSDGCIEARLIGLLLKPLSIKQIKA